MIELLANIDVDNLERAIDFYSRALGLKVGRRLEADRYGTQGLNENGSSNCSRASQRTTARFLSLMPVCLSFFPHLTDCKRGSSSERNAESLTACIPALSSTARARATCGFATSTTA